MTQYERMRLLRQKIAEQRIKQWVEEQKETPNNIVDLAKNVN